MPPFASAGRVAIVVASSVALVGGLAGVARACSCAYGDPRQRLEQADGAFVGTLLAKREKSPSPPGHPISSARPAIYAFRVDEEIKRSFEDEVEVESAFEGASCGLEVDIGEQIGLLVDLQQGRWHSSLCQQMDPDELREAARPLPEPDGEGHVALLIGASMGDVRTVALDGEGRTLAYGGGDGDLLDVAICPRSERAVELVGRWPRTDLFAVRDLSSMSVVREVALGVGGRRSGLFGQAVHCRDRLARSAYVFATDRREPLASSRVLEVSGRKVSVVHRGSGQYASFRGGRALLTSGRRGHEVVAVELGAGNERMLARGPEGLGPVRSSPNRSALATVAYGGYRNGRPLPSRAVVFDLTHQPARVRTARVGREVFGEMLWRGNRRVVFLGDEARPRSVRVFDRRLTLLRAFGGWGALRSALAGKTVYGVGWGRLLGAPLPTGPAREVRTFPTPVTYTLAPVRDRVFVQQP